MLFRNLPVICFLVLYGHSHFCSLPFIQCVFVNVTTSCMYYPISMNYYCYYYYHQQQHNHFAQVTGLRLSPSEIHLVTSTFCTQTIMPIVESKPVFRQGLFGKRPSLTSRGHEHCQLLHRLIKVTSHGLLSYS